MNWWCLLIKVHNLFQCFWTAVTATLSYLPLREKSHARLLLFLLECIVEQLLHKFLWTDVFPVILFRGGSVCLSWLLEPSLSIKEKPLFCYLFWSYVKNTMSLSSDSLVLQHQKDVCCCIYHQAFCLYQLFFFLPFGGFVLLYLTGLSYFSLTAFWK